MREAAEDRIRRTRRGALPRIAGTIALAAVAACAGTTSERADGPVSFGPRFPPLPAGLASGGAAVVVDRRSVPDASIALVQVRQTHFPAGLAQGLVDVRGGGAPGREDLLARLHRANESQRAVHGLLRELAGAGWDRVFAEGVAVEFPQTDRLSLAMEVLGAFHRIDEALGTPPPTLAERFLAHGAAGPPGDEEWERFRYVPGAEVLLALDGTIRLLPAERRELLRGADAALRERGPAAAAAWSPEREASLLGVIAAAGDGPAVVLLGAAHDLADDVDRWNAAHPSRRIALAVVNPERAAGAE